MSNQASSPPIVITGIGIVSPIGIGVDAVRDALRTGRTGVGKVELFECAATPGRIGGEVKDFTDETAKKVYLKSVRKNLKVMCREIQLGVASAGLAIENSGLDVSSIPSERLGVDFGANLMLTPPGDLAGPCFASSEGKDFQISRWGDAGLSNMEPLWLLKYLPNMPACHIGILANAQGPSNSLTQGEASGNLAIAEGASVMRRGWADALIAGATGTRVHPVKSVHAALWETLGYNEADPSRSCRPFDKNRNGQVVGEGACSFLLETEEHARARGATIWGRILGTGAACASGPNGAADCRTALVHAMKAALRTAGLSPADVGHINAHGLSTQAEDAAEAAAIHDVFGERGKEIPVTAIKSYTGNAGASCGTIELAASLISLKAGFVPPTLGYQTPDPQCELNVVREEPMRMNNKVFLNLSVTRAGQAAAVLVDAA